jgi:hypothetical protein
LCITYYNHSITHYHQWSIRWIFTNIILLNNDMKTTFIWSCFLLYCHICIENIVCRCIWPPPPPPPQSPPNFVIFSLFLTSFFVLIWSHHHLILLCHPSPPPYLSTFTSIETLMQSCSYHPTHLALAFLCTTLPLPNTYHHLISLLWLKWRYY